jgi:hypothetical protein
MEGDDYQGAVSEKTERWAFERIRELEHRVELLRTRVWELRRSRDLWRERAIKRAKR